MSKAFDSDDHQILLRKIQGVGASTSAQKWFNSYLINRYQVVRIHSSFFGPLPVECGVPQGSIQGPLLFSIYENDLPEVPRHCSTECYVEGTKLFVSSHLHDSRLNPDKTKLIVFRSRQMTSKLHEFPLTLLGKDISPVQSARDLGVILDPNLTFDKPYNDLSVGMYRTSSAN